jgi:hypothetical protein
MNERIRDLADQILPNEKEFHKGDPKDWGYFFTGEELEKFAELIVRECSQVSLTVSHRNDDMGAIIARMIKQYFGVE